MKYCTPYSSSSSFSAVRFVYDDKLEITTELFVIDTDFFWWLIRAYSFDNKKFFTLNGAKKYMDSRLKELGYHLFDSYEEMDKYKILL
jgi:hypothetical protein